MTQTTQVLELGARVLQGMAPAIQGVSADRFAREMRRLGVPAALVPDILGVLVSSGLAALKSPTAAPTLTRDGERTSVALTRGDWIPYASAMLTLPWLRSQLMASIQFIESNDRGTLIKPRTVHTSAPELAAVLAWLPQDPSDGGAVVVPAGWLESLHLVESDALHPTWVLTQEAVGRRAEMYSLHYERTRKSPSAILWVAAESDRFGYDLEDRSVAPFVAIEVKGSAGSALRFFLSAHEEEVATQLAERYVIQFWGEIQLGANPRVDYHRVRALGYPIELRDPIQMLRQSQLRAVPASWLVTRG